MATKLAVMMGVETFLAALMISLMRGTPCVTFIDATPAKWKVFSVICVPGSPIDCAPTAPTCAPPPAPAHVRVRLLWKAATLKGDPRQKQDWI